MRGFCTWRQECTRAQYTTHVHLRQGQNKDPILFLLRPRFISTPSLPNENLLTTSPTDRGPIGTTIRNCAQPRQQRIILSRLSSSPSRVIATPSSDNTNQGGSNSIQCKQGRQATLIMPITHRGQLLCGRSGNQRRRARENAT